MTKIVSYRCDVCGYEDSQDDPSMTMREQIYQCYVCDLDVCGSCAENHAKDETGLDWNIQDSQGMIKWNPPHTCHVCHKKVCVDCVEDHARNHTGLDWE